MPPFREWHERSCVKLSLPPKTCFKSSSQLRLHVCSVRDDVDEEELKCCALQIRLGEVHKTEFEVKRSSNHHDCCCDNCTQTLPPSPLTILHSCHANCCPLVRKEGHVFSVLITSGFGEVGCMDGHARWKQLLEIDGDGEIRREGGKERKTGVSMEGGMKREEHGNEQGRKHRGMKREGQMRRLKGKMKTNEGRGFWRTAVSSWRLVMEQMLLQCHPCCGLFPLMSLAPPSGSCKLVSKKVWRCVNRWLSVMDEICLPSQIGVFSGW